MTEDHSRSGGGAAVVIVVVLLLLVLPCAAGVLLLGGFMVFRMQAPIAAPAPMPADMALPGGTVTVNTMSWSGNLFEDADKVLTLAKYEQIQPGMSYDQVVAILEIPEAKRPPDMELIGPESDVELKWFGGENDARSITIKLKGKTVVEVAHSGLQ
jgi:hypothetical protein